MKSMSQLAYHYGVKMRIYPSSKQKQIIKLNSDITRFVYNKMIEINQQLYQLKQIKIPILLVQQQINELEKRKNMRYLSNHYLFLNNDNIDSLTKANAYQNYQKAWKQYHKVHFAGTPKFHKKNYCEKYQTNALYGKNKSMDMFSGSVRFVDNKHVRVPKLNILRVSGSSYRKLLDDKTDIRIGTVTISKTIDDKYFLSMQLASDTPFVKLKPKTDTQVGIDLNTDNFLTTSDNEVIANPRYYRKSLKRLRKEQRKLSRRQLRAKKEHRSLRDSKNYQKQRLLVARLHAKVFRQRENFLNNVSTALINSHDLVVAEHLQSKNMLKNHALAMSISDVGWRSFLDKLAYKADLYNKMFIMVDPKNTTQTCSQCGYICGSDNRHAKLTLKDRQWVCPNCHTKHIRDVNASINILNKGLAQLAK